jgi:hypothetical protein
MCRACGDQPVSYRRARYCDDCREIQAEAAAARKRANERAQRLPCKGCGRVKPPGRAREYCDACQRKKAGPRICLRCPNPSRSKFAKLCVECKAAAREADRDYQRRWNLANQDKARSGPSYNDSRRMNKRLHAEADGRELKMAPPILKDGRAAEHGQRADSEMFPPLPAAPLAALVDRMIAREVAGPYVKGGYMRITGESGKLMPPDRAPRDDAPSAMEAVCERLGISSKTLREWRDGSRPTARFDVADRIVTRAEACWWDVWPGDPLAEFAFTGERAA